MENRIAAVSIIVENNDSIEKINSLLHDYRQYVIGRMGIPYHKKGVNIISVALDAPNDVISSLAGKLGNLPGVSAKTALSVK